MQKFLRNDPQLFGMCSAPVRRCSIGCIVRASSSCPYGLRSAATWILSGNRLQLMALSFGTAVASRRQIGISPDPFAPFAKSRTVRPSSNVNDNTHVLPEEEQHRRLTRSRFITEFLPRITTESTV